MRRISVGGIGMRSEELWKKFTAAGSVQSYLDYKKAAGGTETERMKKDEADDGRTCDKRMGYR